MKTKRIFLLFLAVLTVLLAVSCGSKPKKTESTPCEYYLARREELSGRDVAYVTLEIKGMGDIKLALDATAAPETVRQFLRLVSEGFYDGLGFYRATEDLLIQSGDPVGDGTGLYKDKNGNAVCIDGEFLANGYKGNDIQHKRGVISMFRWADLPDTGSSQFFICNATDPEKLVKYDDYFAAFGYVIDGMEIVDKIAETAKHLDEAGLNIDKKKQAIIKKATIDDLGGIDINERFYLKDGECEYKTRDITGRDVLYAEITIKHYGKVTVLLDRTTAPVTVDNFVKLAREGFYDGLTFHRVLMNGLVQGGDPNADGTGGSKDSIKGEFSENGYQNDLLHKRGVISMARTSDSNDSATSQFFICNADIDAFDGNYAAFGYVVDGLRVVDEVIKSTVLYSSTENGLIFDKDRQAVIESVRIVGDPPETVNYVTLGIIIGASLISAAVITVGTVIICKKRRNKK